MQRNSRESIRMNACKLFVWMSKYTAPNYYYCQSPRSIHVHWTVLIKLINKPLLIAYLSCIINKHNCVLSNTGLSNAPTKTGFYTSLKSGFYFRFYSPSNTKSTLPNFISTWDLMLSCWKVCSPEPENCRNQNSHTSKIGNLLPVCVTNRRAMRRHSWAPCKIWWKSVKNCGRNT